MNRFSKNLILTATAAALYGSPALAQSVINDYANEREAKQQNDWTGFVAAGAAVLPEYDGSEDFQAIPILQGQLNKGNYYVATRGLGLVANVVDSNRFNFGPIVNFRFGRDDDVDNAIIARMREIDDAIETGAFASVITRDNLMANDNLEFSIQLTQDVGGGHGGVLGEIGASYFAPVRRDLRLGLNVGVDYQSDDYMEEYFSVDANNAARSGLRQYNAEGGFNSGSIGTMALYSINQQWGLMGIVQYTRWIGDAADSPIIDDEGTKNQVFGAVGVTYRF